MVGFSSLRSRSCVTKPTVMPRKHGDSCVTLCETVRAFVHAVSQLFCTPPTPPQAATWVTAVATCK